MSSCERLKLGLLLPSSIIAEEDLRIKMSYLFNEVTAVFLLNNPCYHHTSHSDEPLSYYSNVFDSTVYNAPSHARDVHSVVIQEQPVTMHSSFNVCMSGITCITYYYKAQYCNIYLETVAKLSKWFPALLLIN